ncbi:hypothetical protein A1D29_03525 [Pasteurellaceae bacterium Orientalotternb1]|nr:hypothetical protein A1D29_03525 [Pasteurellaceae bacterium Orientalotternb1]
MRDFIKKHYILSTFILGLCGWGVYLYFSYFRYSDDREDIRLLPIQFSESKTTGFIYKTKPKVKYRKYFTIGLSLDNLYKISSEENGDKIYNDISEKYNYLRSIEETEEQFYQEAEKKFQISLKLYQDNVLKLDKKIFFPELSYGFSKVHNNRIWLIGGMGFFSFKEIANYEFTEDTEYRLEVTPNNLFPEYQEIEFFLIIHPMMQKH